MLKVITGNEAAAYGALLCRPKIVCAYPITPQSRIPELLSEFYAEGLLDGKFVNVESEMSALGYVIGGAQAGVRVFTATSSQGLAWMHEGLHWAVGARLPIVLVNVNRPLAPPWNLTCDHSDSLSQRDTGWLQFYCESNQEILDTVIQAYRIAESVNLPCMVCLDGVYLSYLAESVDVPDQSRVDEYLPPFKTTLTNDNRFRMFIRTPAEQIGYEQYDYMTNRYQLHKLEGSCVDAALHANEEFKIHFDRGYDPVEQYKCLDADIIVLMSGSAVGTCRYVIDMMRDEGYKVGLVKLKMFRPFPKDLVRQALLGRKKVAVIDRDLSPGECGIIYQEVKWALNMSNRNHAVPLYGFISGLGGADISTELIREAILYMIRRDPPEDEVIWLGKIKNEAVDQDENIINIS